MNNSINMLDKNCCTGCGACRAACPKDAISFKADNEGFPSPIIDGAICVNCGVCVKSCPAMTPVNLNRASQAYAAQISDKEMLKFSTSGGLFTALALFVLENKGAVYGCKWDPEYNAVFNRATTVDEIEEMKGSKYVWSWSGDVLKMVKCDLDDDRLVLFAGLPCQVAGLRQFLKREYTSLFTLDFLCSGTPSPLALRKWIDNICDEKDLSALNLKFRDKNPYGVGVHITYNGVKAKKHGEHITNPYYYAFYSHLIDRRCCYKCKYGTDDRVSDITIGDYWGIEQFHPELDIKSGVSSMLINTDRGKWLIQQIDDRLILTTTLKENIGKSNNLICDGTTRDRKIPFNRSGFFESLSNNDWKTAERKYLYDFTRFKRLVKSYIKAII